MTNRSKTNKARNKGRSKGRSIAQDRRRLRKAENLQTGVTRDAMLGRVIARGYGGGVVTKDGPVNAG